MNIPVAPDTAWTLIQLLLRTAPQVLDLITAQTSKEFQDFFEGVMAAALADLEANSKNYANLSEDGLSSVLATSLNTFGLCATRETNSNGHADITVTVLNPKVPRKTLGEAKIYHGPAYHIKGLDQLLNRYTRGREERGFVVSYVKTPNITGLVASVRAEMDATLPCDQQSPTTALVPKWSFLSIHKHSCGENLEVAHYGCNLHA